MDATLTDALLTRADHGAVAIDWCEANYAVSPHVAEFWNTISSLLFVLAGAHAGWRALALRLPALHACAAALVACTGLASAYYHASLHLVGQRADEVFENAALAALLHIGGHPPTPAWAVGVHVTLAAAGVLLVSAFLFTELHLIVTAVCLTVRLSRQTLPLSAASPHLGGEYAARTRAAAGAAALGALAWLVDRSLCSVVSAWRVNPQLHAWWHVLGAVALHEACACAALVHCVLGEGGDATAAPVKVGSILGLLTVVRRDTKGR